MPHFPHTPEALLGRNDSKNPATTCKGITSSGRACRRALALAISRSRSNVSALNGVVALVQADGTVQEADFYCWQHKDQAAQRLAAERQAAAARPQERVSTELFPLKERESIDTLVQRLGIDAAAASDHRKPQTHNPRPPRRTSTSDFAKSRPAQAQAPYAEKYGFVPPPRQQKKRPGFWESLCCMTANGDDYVEIVRHRRRVDQRVQRPPQMTTAAPSASMPARKPLANSSPQPPPPQHRSSRNQTGHLLSLIPENLAPQTTSTLLAELVKPISPCDEDGYIYIFWLTPQSQAAPPEATAQSLLAPAGSRPQYARRISDVMTEYSYDGSESDQRDNASKQQKTIMLKIGRANNITRRMHEWQRQCGYALNLVRWYPYVSSATTPSPMQSPQSQRDQPLYPDLTQPPPRPPTGRRESEAAVHKCPHIHRVERLVHLELASKQARRQCGACGKEHREWFEVPATQAGIKAVDEVVKRWIGWAESHSN